MRGALWNTCGPDPLWKRPMADAWNRCDECGRFVSYDDLAEGRAVHQLLEPDSDLGGEKWETLCPKHVQPQNGEASR